MLSLPAIAKRMTQGFRLAKLELEFPNHSEWEVPFDPSLYAVLAQPFTYIGKGSQSYVFESKDGEYVIKFFRFDRHLGIRCNHENQLKVLTVFNACKIAYDLLRDETGLIYMHLNLTPLDLPILHCKDPLGRTVRFNLNHYRFAIQKKAQPFRSTLLEARGDPAKMQKRIDEFIDLLQSRTSKGVFNTDPTLSRNFGFLKDRAVEIDFGNYRPTSNHDQFTEIKRYTNRLRRWLEIEAPEWVGYLDQRVEAIH